jgi:hypothetical protein
MAGKSQFQGRLSDGKGDAANVITVAQQATVKRRHRVVWA